MGGLLGKNASSVGATFADGAVSGGGDYVGGLMGSNIGIVTGSYAAGAVSGVDDFVGGLIGQNGGTVRSTYAMGDVSGDSSVGGLIGDNTSTVKYSFAASSSVTGRAAVRGLIGSMADEDTSVTNSYWDTTIGPSASRTDPGEGKTTSELQTPTSNTGIYANWQSAAEGDVWDFGTASQYPALKADLDGDGTRTIGEFGRQRWNQTGGTGTPTPAPSGTPTATPSGTPTATATPGIQSASVSGASVGTPTPTPTPTPDGATGQSSVVAIDLSVTSLTVKEGGTASYTVKLNNEPYADVTVAISTSSLGIVTADNYSLTFTSDNWDTAQTVTLSGTQDDDKYDDTVQVKHAASGGGYGDGTNVTASFNATVDDDDNDGTLVASDATATTVLLTMSTYSGDWWYQRAGWSECRGPVTTSTYRVTGLAVNASSYINAYHTSNCGANDGITQGNRFTTANPELTVSDITANSLKLTISEEWDASKDGPWRYGVTGGWCSGATYNQNWTNLAGQPENTTYTFAAFSDADCHVGVTPAITFSTLQIPASDVSLAASDPSAMSVTLTITGFDYNAWWYQRAGWSECHGPVTTATYRVRGLAPGASSYINAYRTSSCGTNDGIAQSNRFSTLASPVLTASNITQTSARLNISYWDFTNDGHWYFGKSGVWCSAPVSQNYSDKTDLTANTQYQYAVYVDASCSARVTSFVTFTTPMVPVSVSNLNASGDNGYERFGIVNGETHKLAVAFRTGQHGNGYRLQSVTIKSRAFQPTLPAIAKLYTNTSDSTPNQHQATLDSSKVTAGQDTTFTCTHSSSNNCDISPNTIYQITLETNPVNCSGNCYNGWQMTSSGTETNSPSNAGWTIGNEYARWSSGSWTRIYNDGVGRIKINAGMR